MSEEKNKYWDERALDRLTDAEKSSEAYIISIKKMYNQAYKDINKELETVYKNYAKETGLDVQKLKELLTRSETKKTWEQMKKQGLDEYIKDNYKSRISRLEQIQAQIYGKAKQIYPKEELAQTMCYEGVINESYYKTIYDTQIGTGYDFSFNKLDQKTLTKVLNERWSGKNYSERIWGNTDILAQNLSEILGGALISGQSIEKTSKQIRDRFNVAKYYSERLVRTETNHFNNEADALAYEEMGVNKYVFVATLDSRTSKACRDMDNEVIEYKEKKNGFNFPPLHPNCRSKTRGYLGKEAEKMIMRRAINPETGEPELIDNMSYKNWLNKNNLIAGSGNDVQVEYKGTTIEYLGKISPKKINDKIKEFKETMIDEPVEHSYIFTENNEFYHLIGNDNEIHYPPEINLKNAIGIHNHPKNNTRFSFSWEDFDLFLRGNMKQFDGIDYMYVYSMKRNFDTNYDVEVGEIQSLNNSLYYNMLDYIISNDLSVDADGFDYIANKISNKYNINYERKKT